MKKQPTRYTTMTLEQLQVQRKHKLGVVRMHSQELEAINKAIKEKTRESERRTAPGS